jgi:hypothetical protein
LIAANEGIEGIGDGIGDDADAKDIASLLFATASPFSFFVGVGTHRQRPSSALGSERRDGCEFFC